MAKIESRTPPGIVHFLRIVGGLHITAAVIFGIIGAVRALNAYTSLQESNGDAMFGIGEAVLVCGVFFLALAFITDKLDSIDHHLKAEIAQPEE